MRVHTTILLLLVSSSVLAALHMLALEFSLYWQYPWFDVPMHFLGGAIVALGLFAALDFGLPLPKWAARIIPILLFVLAVGIVWELWEFAAEISTRERNFVFDTTLDICMDMLGGAFGYIIGSRVRRLD